MAPRKPARAFVRPAAKRSGGAAPPSRGRPVESKILRLQEQAGNRAVSAQLAPAATTQRPKAYGEGVAEMLATEAPVLLGLLPADGIAALQAQVDATANNEAVQLGWKRRARELEGDDESRDPQHYDAAVYHPQEFAKYQDAMMEAPKHLRRTFTIEARAVLDVDGIRTSPGANSLDRTFREKIFEELSGAPLEVEIAPMRYGPRVGLLGPTYTSNRWTIDHTKGIVHFDDLVRVNGRYHHQYIAEVSANPVLAELDAAIRALAIQVGTIRNDHFERSALNARHGLIRRISESLGGPSMSDYLEMMKQAQQHPERGSVEEQMKALEAPYPSVKIWEAPEAQIGQAGTLLKQGDFDLAMLAFMQASNSSQTAAQQYQRYEEKVMKGAGLAVKWLERLKTAGKLAAGVATGGLALEAQAAAAAGYAILQEGGQQVSERAYGQRSSIDLAGLARLAVTEGAMAYFSGLTQGTFTNALSARFETQLADAWGPTLAKKAISATGAATAAFYAVPANTVLNRILSGAPMPTSMDELTKMVLDETLKNGGMDVALGFLHSHGAAGAEGEHPTEAGAPREGITPPREGLGAAGEHGAAEPVAGGAPQSVAPGATPQPVGNPHFLELVAHAGSEPTARDALIDHFGSWEETIAALKTGTGDLAPIGQAAREAMIHTLVAHRTALVGELATRFGAEQAKTASNEPGSDVDVNMTGAEAGLHSAEAMAFLDANHPGWRRRFRMDVMVDAGRSKTLAGELAKLPAHERDGIARRQAETTEALLLGREARNAHTPEERAEILGRIPNAELRARARTLAELDPVAAKAEHLRLLAHSDRAIAAIDPNGSTADRAAQVGEALDTQAQANAFDPEAYVSTSTIRSVVLGERVDVIGRYEGVIEQLDMLAHQAHEAGGMRGALRRYETYKYVQRICDQLTGAGITDSRIAFLRNQGEMVYKMDRGAMASSDPRTVSPRDVTGKSNMAYEEYGEVPGVSDAFLTDVHDMLQGLVDDHLPLLRTQAMGPAAAGAALPQPMRVPELGPAEASATAPGAGPGPAGGGGAQATANPLDRTGLRAPDAVARVADAIADRGAPPATTTLDQYATELLAPIRGELAAIGTRPPAHVTVDLKNPSSWGYFDATTNQIVINEGALIDGKPAFDLTDPAGRQRVATLVFHESRHAEQYFRAMQYAASGAAPAGVVIPPSTGIHPDIVAAAYARPIAHGSPEFEAGRLAYDEFYGQNHPWMQYGQDAQRTQFLRNEIDRLQTARELAEEQLKNVRWWQLGSTAAIKGRIAGLQNQLIQLHGELNHRQQVYFALFHEHDAYGAQHDLERELPAARLRSAEHDLHDALEQLDAVRRLLPAEEARALTEAGAALQHYWDSLESMGRSLRTGGGAAVPAGQAAATP